MPTFTCASHDFMTAHILEWPWKCANKDVHTWAVKVCACLCLFTKIVVNLQIIIIDMIDFLLNYSFQEKKTVLPTDILFWFLYLGCCYPILLRQSHPCVEGAMHHDCPVCFEVRLMPVTFDVIVWRVFLRAYLWLVWSFSIFLNLRMRLMSCPADTQYTWIV